MSAAKGSLKLLSLKAKGEICSSPCVINMLGSWRQKCLVLTLLAFIVLSESSRLPKSYWEQMLPKKLPSPSSSPSRGTNSVTTSSSTALKTDRNLPSSDGKV
ncbi:Glutamate-gated kainate-type ion channel receptor subunit GluR5 [Quillaja saponaria]|uniref:Glutamate-gated kainate-type ion channel receptor subunit GluR5 n=1 Tax=Quillaja saponaria TaxID=32244 RepID=A0AAD7PKP4_QUISA|nr:Glutamate-gated kainate-type ion channel receptor subunit GluR5 [Quillaja saponaria]